MLEVCVLLWGAAGGGEEKDEIPGKVEAPKEVRGAEKPKPEGCPSWPWVVSGDQAQARVSTVLPRALGRMWAGPR